MDSDPEHYLVHFILFTGGAGATKDFLKEVVLSVLYISRISGSRSELGSGVKFLCLYFRSVSAPHFARTVSRYVHCLFLHFHLVGG
jgi:hypothetical protein